LRYASMSCRDGSGLSPIPKVLLGPELFT
jgi:hypothetical protein